MPLPFSDSPADRTRLARIGGVNVDHAQSDGFSLIGDKVLQLSEGPAVQPCPDSLSGLDVSADIGQVFHADFAGSSAQRFRNNGFAGFVVHVPSMSFLAPRDSLEFAPCGTATVGLEATTMGKVDVPVMPEFPAAPDLASAGSCEVILAHIDTENATAGNGRSVGKVKDEVEVPDAFTKGQFRFFGSAARKQVALMLATSKLDLDATGHREQREHIIPKRVGALIEVDGRGVEGDCWDWLVLGNTLVGLECLIGVRDPMDGLANHLAAECGELLAHGVVGQVVQRNAVPTAVLLGKRDDGIAGLSVGIRKSRQRRSLVSSGKELKRNRPFHI